MNAREKKSSTSASGKATSAKPRVLVVDDHPIVREGLAELINRQGDFHCTGGGGTVAEAEHAISSCKPDLLLLDLRLGQADGLESIKILKARFPELRILVISQFDEGTYAERSLRAGAAGYLMKEQATDEVLRAIRMVLAGEIYVSPKVGTMAMMQLLQDKPARRATDLGALTDRELYIFKAIGTGKSNKQIAADLKLSVKTIETYREHIKHKLGIASGAELAERARNSERA
jgi:DNA-binding NarL/FixJ family response regulator